MNRSVPSCVFSWRLFSLQVAGNVLTYGIFVSIWSVQRSVDKTGLFALCGLSLLRVLISWVAIFETCRLYKGVAAVALESSEERFLRDSIDHSTLYRRIRQIFDFVASREDYYANLISIVAVICFIVSYIGLQGISILIMAALGLGLVNLIQRASLHAFEKVNEFSASRNQRISKILEYREAIVGISERSENAARELRETLGRERRWLAIDSALKVGETYLGMVLKLLPFIVAMIATHFGLRMATSQAQLILWISIPISAAILAMPRQLQSIKGRSDGIDATWDSTQNRQQTAETAIRFGEHQNIWRASLSVNLLGSSSFHRESLKELGLWEELGLSAVSRPFDFRLDPDQLSEGQKQRLIILRSVSLARASSRTLIIDSPLHALDMHNRARVSRLLTRLCSKEKLEVIGIEKLEVADERSNLPPVDSSEVRRPADADAVSVQSHKLWIMILMLTALPFFFIAGSLDAAVTERLNSIGGIDVLGGVAAIGGFFLAVFSGVLVEGAIRKRASSDLCEAIFERITPSRDISKSIPVDLDATFESFSFYTHDLTWAVALFIVFSASVIYGAGIKGGLLALATLCLLGGLYYFLFGSIVVARENYLNSSRNFSDSLQSLRAFDAELSRYSSEIRLRRVRAALSVGSFYEWISGSIRLIKLKGELAVALDLMFQVALIVGLILLIQKKPTFQTIPLAFYVAALLGVQRESSRLFVALSGMLTAITSFERIRSLKTSRATNSISWEILPTTVKLSESVSSQTGIRYCAHEFTPGLTWVSGASGLGKSTLLMDLFWTLRDSGRRVLYFRRADVPRPGTQWVYEITGDRAWCAGTCIILDEATTRLSKNELEKIVSHLNEWAIGRSVVVLVVEHRYDAHYAGNVFFVGQHLVVTT